MWTLLTSLGMIAATLLLDKTVNRIDELKAKEQGVSQDDVLRIINEMTNEARSKGSHIANQLANKLSKVSVPVGASSAVKDKIVDARRELSKIYNDYVKDYSEIENKLNNIDQRASALAYQSADYREKFGAKDLEKIKDDVQEPLNKYNEISKGVEKYV